VDADISQLAKKESSSKMHVSAFSGRKNGKLRVDMTTYSQCHDSTICPLQTTNFHLTMKKGGGRWLGRCSICPTAKDR